MEKAEGSDLNNQKLGFSIAWDFMAASSESKGAVTRMVAKITRRCCGCTIQGEAVFRPQVTELARWRSDASIFERAWCLFGNIDATSEALRASFR